MWEHFYLQLNLYQHNNEQCHHHKLQQLLVHLMMFLVIYLIKDLLDLSLCDFLIVFSCIDGLKVAFYRGTHYFNSRILQHTKLKVKDKHNLER